MKFAVLGAIVLGCAFLILSVVWSSVFPPTNSWTPEKAKRISEVKARLNDLGFQLERAGKIHSGPDPGTLKAEYNTLRKEFDELRTSFESVASSPQTASKILKWSGISIAICGVIGWYAINQSR